MRKKIIAIAAACAVIMSLASCNVNMKDYSSNADTEAAGSLTVSDSSNTSDDEKVIGYDIYRPGQESSSADSDSPSSSSSSSKSTGSSSSADRSDNTSSKSTSSDKTSSKSTSSEKTSSDKTSAEVSSDDSTSSYYDDWEDDNVIYFSELLGG
ncbi:MAG: hypothetical protein K6F76_03860 [Clostridiales bacterium]|nr:hypothetical protein [Clostridiales bacterium]